MLSTTRKLILGLRPSAGMPVYAPLSNDRDDAAVEPVTLALRVALALVLLLGFTIRLIGLNTVGFNTDEAVYAGQAAGILNDGALRPYFPVFRAHPLLFQFMLALVYAFTGVNDYVGRLLAVVIGTITLLAVFGLGRTLYGARTGVIAALFVAVMPYHVVVTRQVLLDGPMTLFASLALCAMAQFAQSQRTRWLYAAGVCTGLTFLAKETGIIFLAAFYLFIVLSPTVRVRLRDLLLSLAIMTGLMTIFPLAISLSGAGRTGQNYLLWQLLRRSNHEWTFYATTALPMIGPALVLAAAASLMLRWRAHTWRETLLVTWIMVPVVFFQLWPVKGYQYLLPITPAVAVLAATLFTRNTVARHALEIGRLRVPVTWIRATGVMLIVLMLGVSSWTSVNALPTVTSLAGMGGLPGGRETGEWFKANTPVGTEAIAIGPNLANLIQFYGHRKAHMLSISQNPLQRNPAYEPIDNPDLRLRNGDVHYIIWDVYSAGRSPFFEKKLMTMVARFHGRPVHMQMVNGKPVVVVYEVRP